MKQSVLVPLHSTTILLSIITGILSVFIYSKIFLPTFPSGDTLLPAFDASQTSCAAPTYLTHILSYDPLILHLENFLTESERKHILELA